MNRPRTHISILVFIAFLIPILGFSPATRAQPPPSAPAEGPAEAKRPPAPRVKPQVIYHVPRVSGNAAALHAQAKAENNTLPIDGNMPISLQMARAAANAEAAQGSPAPSRSPNQNAAMTPGANRRHKAEKGTSRSIAPRQGTRKRNAGTGPRGGAGHVKKQKK